MSVTLTIDQPNDLLDKAMKSYGISKKAAKRAEIIAINATVQWLHTQVARHLSSDLGLAQKHVKQRVRVYKASYNKTQAKFWLGVFNILLFKFGKGRALGQGYQVKDHFVKNGFRAKMPTGHEGIFSRRGSKRLGIDEESVSIQDEAQQNIDRLFNRAEAELKKRLNKAFAREMDRGMRGY